MKLHLKGNSGCNLTVEDGIVRKISTKKSYNFRLKNQFDKQKNFECSIFRTPLVRNHGYYENKFFFEMDYIPFKSFDQAFKFADKGYLDIICSKILSFIDNNIDGYKKFESSIIIKKFESTFKKIPNAHTDLSYLIDLFESMDKKIELPEGFCHGDLTLSNLLFNNDDIVVIDFLDTFLDSPIKDIVKIRQDTQFHWSLRMLKLNYDRVKIIQCLNYIDNKLHNEFKKYDFYLNTYKIFQILNFLRIIPYCNNDYDVQFLKKRIKLLCIQR